MKRKMTECYGRNLKSLIYLTKHGLINKALVIVMAYRYNKKNYQTGAIQDPDDEDDFTFVDLIKEIEKLDRREHWEKAKLRRHAVRQDRKSELAYIAEKLSLQKIESLYGQCPSEFDTSGDFLEVENQGGIPSCTAHAATALIDFYEKQVYGDTKPTSKVFLYNTTRKLSNKEGRKPVSLRATISALRLFGVPPEEYIYDSLDYDQEPTAYHYSLAKEYQTIRYFKLDSGEFNDNRSSLLKLIKLFIHLRIPPMFTFTVYDHVYDPETQKTGIIQHYEERDLPEFFHAVVAVGYAEQNSEKGYIKFRNSWGKEWGDQGYGYLPYSYVLDSLANNFWVILEKEWVSENKIGFKDKSNAVPQTEYTTFDELEDKRSDIQGKHPNRRNETPKDDIEEYDTRRRRQ